MIAQLKPCPFCGEIPEIETRDVEPQGDSWYGRKDETFVLCKCGACLFDDHFHEGFGTSPEGEARAVAAWNRRAKPAEEVQPVALKTHGAWDGLEDLDSLPDGTALYTRPPAAEADRLDAERYRFMRDPMISDSQHKAILRAVDDLEGEQMDVAIDAALVLSKGAAR